LLAEAGAPDPDLRADVLLAALAAEQVRHWLLDEGRAVTTVRDALTEMAQQLAGRTGRARKASL
jgi:hypothetical protein